MSNIEIDRVCGKAFAWGDCMNIKYRIAAEAGRCLLCSEPACTKHCDRGLDAGRIIRALNFENYTGAVRLWGEHSCENCDASCEAACRRGRMDYPVHIRDLMSDLETMARDISVPEKQPDLSVEFCGVKCENPFFLSSSVVGSNYEMVAKAFRMGWAGVSFKTISRLDINEASPRFAALEKEGRPFVGFKNIEQLSDHPYEENLETLRRLKHDFPTKVIIASIMGRNVMDWSQIAHDVEEAGADIIECNFSCPQMVGEQLGSEIGIDPSLVWMYTRAVRRSTSLPILAKMTPNITYIAEPAKAAIDSGAQGIAAINTIKSIMNINLDSFVSEPDVQGKCSPGGYSGKAVKPIALRFIYDLQNDPALSVYPVSGMGGIETWRDAAEFIAMGCGSLQVTTAVMQYGYRIIEDLKEGLADYLAQNGMNSVSELVGRALPNVVEAHDLERNTIEYPKFHLNECIACGRCYLSCYDGGHQAIILKENGTPQMDVSKCVGCQLCRLICPTGAITAGKRVPKHSAK